MPHSKREKIMEAYNAAQRLKKMERYAEAARYLADCLANCREVGDDASCETVLGELASCYEKAGSYDESLRTLSELLQLVSHEGPTQRRAILHHNIAFVYQLKAEYGEAEEHYRRSAQVAAEAGDSRGRGMSLTMLGQVLLATQRYDEGFDSLLAAIKLLDEADAPELDRVIEHTQSMRRETGYAALAERARDVLTDVDTLRRLLDA